MYSLVRIGFLVDGGLLLMIFTKRDTNIVKGIAILAMLFHHTFPNNPGIPIINSDGFSFQLLFATSSKICVSLLTILSGYGLMESYKKSDKPKMVKKLKFVFSHYIQLLSMYWVILFFCLLASYLESGNNIAIYGSGIQSIKFFIIDLFGLGILFNTPVFIGGWYLTAIIGFYFLFPLSEFMTKKLGIWFLAVTYIPWIYYLIRNDYNMHTDWWLFYLFSFAIGIYLSQRNILNKIKAKTNKKCMVYCLAFFVAMFGLRFYLALPADSFLSLAIIFVEVCFISKLSALCVFLEKFGAMSANMWLLHVFIIGKLYNFSFADYVAKYIILCIISYSLSLLIEEVKVETGYNRLVKKARGLLQ